MRRLTEPAEKHFATVPKEVLKNREYSLDSGIIIEKLGAYEDLEEKGLLLHLPIALGAPCYVIVTCQCGKHWGKCRPDNIKPSKAKAVKPYKTYAHMNYCLKVYERPFKINYLGYYGKRVFATFEEAEAAMQKMGE